jgi:TatD DNase family protein
MTLIDSHCHLDDKQFNTDRGAVIERALRAGVDTMIAIGTGDGPPDLEAGVRLAAEHDFIFATVGVHPHNAAHAEPETPAQLRELLRQPKIVALGEIGLDYHYDFSPRERQREVFVRQLELAREARKPVIIHTREAWDDTVAILREHWAPAGLPGVMHCFSGGPAEARVSLDLGFFVSFAGIVTYPKATEIHEAAKLVPLDRLMAETDSPYLAPVPKRGKRNEPAFVVHTVERLATLRGQPLDEVAAATVENTRRVFDLPGLLGRKPTGTLGKLDGI